MQVTFARMALQRLWTPYAGMLQVLLLASCHPRNAKEATMQPSILDSTEAQLRQAQAKITYLGVQIKPIATVVFHTAGYEAVMGDFSRIHRTRELYTNDELPYTRFFTVTAQEFSDILRSVKPVLSDPAVPQGPEFLSFTVLRKENLRAEGSEFWVGPKAAKRFYESILVALRRDNDPGRQILHKQCADALPR